MSVLKFILAFAEHELQPCNLILQNIEIVQRYCIYCNSEKLFVGQLAKLIYIRKLKRWKK